ncbi:putative protein HOTHEAD [Cocos nucifera]|uniref:Protein kinase domain-containing protein n=2 Tax=Magnoliopsida TaxID=3398 RepID=A0A8K0N2B3_COCNU|nr:putative protein HOTHEAD [Cocos nucifera]
MANDSSPMGSLRRGGSSGHPWINRILLSAASGPPPNELDMKLQPSSMLAPSILSPLEPPSTGIKEKGPTPAYLPKSQSEYACSQIMVPEGAVLHPPEIMPPKSEVLPPSTPVVIPLMQPSAPPEHVTTKQGPVIISPSIRGLTPTFPVWEGKFPSIPHQFHYLQENLHLNHLLSSFYNFQWQAVHPKSIAFPIIHGNGYSTPTTAPPKELSNHLTPAVYSFPEGPAVSPTSFTSPTIHGHGYNMPVAAPQKESSSHLSPVNYSHTKGPAVSPTSISVPANHGNRYRMPVAAPPTDSSSNLSPVNNSHPKGPAISPTSITSPTNHENRYGMPVAAAPTESSGHLSPVYYSHPKGPAISPTSVSSPANHGNRYGMPVAAPSTESSSHLSPVNHSLPKVSTISPISIPSPGTPPNGHGMPVAAPTKEFSRHLSPVNYSHPKRPGVSPAPTTPPANYGIYGMPVPVPPKDISSRLSPKNYLHAKGSFPVISPAPHEAHRPLDTAHSPFASHPQPPIQRILHSPAPAPVFSFRQPTARERTGSLASAPSPQSHNPGPVVSPAPTTSPANYGRYGMPVPAPPKDISSHLSPKNYSHPKGSFPVISPAPHEADRPSGTVHSPFTPPPQPPIQRRLHSPAPAPVFSFRQPTARERTGSLASAPSPQSHNPGPVQSPVLPPASASRKPQAPQLQPFHSLPPPPHRHSSPINYSHPKGPAVSPAPATPPASYGRYGMPAPAPPKDISSPLSSKNYSHAKGSFPVISPAPHEADRPSHSVHSPFTSHPQPPIQRIFHGPAPEPVVSFRHPTARERTRSPTSAPSPQSRNPAPSHPPAVLPKHGREHHAPPPYVQGPSVSQAPFHSADNEGTPTPSPSKVFPSTQNKRPVQSPVLSPSASATGKPRASQLQPFHSLPPPPPNLDCKTPLSCPEPWTNSPPGSPCACVMPIRVGLRLSIALYTFFPLVSELAQEIASGVSMKQSQVRIMGANATSEEYDKTIVLIDLVPLGVKFDNTTAFLVYEKFWHKQVFINRSLFGDYDVLYVYYQGLPPSPPIAPGNIDNGAYGNGNNSSTIDPLAADVRKQKEKQNGTVIAIIVLAAVIALMSLPPCSKASGSVPTIPGSRPSSASVSFNSSIATCPGSAKTFSLAEMERATNKFNDSRILGEGGFGRVYEGTLEDGRRAAIKVLKRDDRHGSREFLAEVEMLSRLHHRNLVKLIGICTEEHARCLVYELVPNGSVESHLYGAHKQSAPLDWNARLKIALGAARGLAYLHEDSSPRVIHRDFKASNILLEDDLTPKVSDFGLARTALDEGNEHISTHVMGTFGYLAPEYAMTGHLLVKSDVYSYGVVLLELLTGRKPVDMLRPPGQENLVTWARPLLTSKDGLETIIDPSLGTIPFDSVAKVAAIASMCVQPEVNQRPFMGEVVQALKLVCNEGNEYRGSGSFSQEEISTQDMEIRISTGFDLELERVISASDIFSTSARFTRDTSGSFRRYSRSGPLRTGRRFHKLRHPHLENGSSFLSTPPQGYDYIIVGGGTAGCPLAATLSQRYKVLLLERGGSPYGNRNISFMENFHISLADGSPTSPSQAFISTDGVINARARVLGGGTCINAGFYTRASPRKLEKETNYTSFVWLYSYVRVTGWDGELVNESYPWIEKRIVHWPKIAPWQTALRKGLLEAGVSPFNGYTYDHLYGTKVGGTIFGKKGFRRTAADLLASGNRTNLRVLLHATVQKIIFDTQGQQPKAVGVLFKDENGMQHQAVLNDEERSEIILSSGAIGSPHLLLVSGIGPKEDLMKLNISVVLDSRHVGKGMSDNPMNSIFIPTKKPVEQSLIQTVGITKVGSFIEASSGFGQSSDSIRCHHGIMSAEIGQLSTIPPKKRTLEAAKAYARNKESLPREAFRGGFILEKIDGPLSTGELSLTDTNVDNNPYVTFNYFSHPYDLERCVYGIRMIEKIVQTRQFANLSDSRVYSMERLLNMSVKANVNLIPKHTNDTASLEQFCRDTVITIWHYHGGCHVGKVVDHDYRVLGIAGLRVIDGSTFVSSPGTNPQATVMMLGRYMGVKILRESVGKSTLLTLLTGTHSEAASYEFTTLTCIPGIIHYNDAKIQLLDLPGIIEGASEGKGRGRQVIAVAKSSDIVLMVLDASKSEGHRQILTRELEAVGLRLNKKPPQWVTFWLSNYI